MDIFENSYHETDRSGSIEVICGSMFSGKTEELIRRVRRAKIAHQKIEIFKPSIDVRYSDTDVVSHNKLANQGIRVIVAGLDMDYLGNPFGPMPQLLAISDAIYKTRAICVRCGHLANYSYRTVKGEQQVMLGEMQEYEPLCRNCYQKMMAQK